MYMGKKLKIVQAVKDFLDLPYATMTVTTAIGCVIKVDGLHTPYLFEDADIALAYFRSERLIRQVPEIFFFIQEEDAAEEAAAANEAFNKSFGLDRPLLNYGDDWLSGGEQDEDDLNDIGSIWNIPPFPL